MCQANTKINKNKNIIANGFAKQLYKACFEFILIKFSMRKSFILDPSFIYFDANFICFFLQKLKLNKKTIIIKIIQKKLIIFCLRYFI